MIYTRSSRTGLALVSTDWPFPHLERVQVWNAALAAGLGNETPTCVRPTPVLLSSPWVQVFLALMWFQMLELVSQKGCLLMSWGLQREGKEMRFLCDIVAFQGRNTRRGKLFYIALEKVALTQLWYPLSYEMLKTQTGCRELTCN